MNSILKTVKRLLQQCISDIDSGDCNLDDEELEKAILSLKQYSRKDTNMSKYQAYTYLNVSRATFDNYVREGKLPKGKKIQGFKELMWEQKDLDAFIKECRNKNK